MGMIDNFWNTVVGKAPGVLEKVADKLPGGKGLLEGAKAAVDLGKAGIDKAFGLSACADMVPNRVGDVSR